MSKSVKPFDFYVNYMDVDLYCFWLIDTYGEDAGFIKIIDDSGLIEQSDNPQIFKKNADLILLEIRQLLVDNGFEEEIAACDKAFSEERKGRGSKNPYIPPSKRDEKGEWKFLKK